MPAPAQQLGFAPEDGGAVGSWVNTGLLPMRLTPVVGDGTATTVVSTVEVAQVFFRSRGEDGRFAVRGEPVVPWSVWVAIVLACALPAVVETARRRPTLRA